MPTVVIVGVQWGDEGKGKIVDFCTEYADVVVRYAGGPNAGHTLVVGDDKLIVRLIPSGILRARTQCVLAQGMVIDPTVLVSEMDELDRRGLSPASRLFVSDRAHMILPFHIVIDTLRETSGKGGLPLGTTKRGIGPAYEDKAARRGLRMGALRDLAKAEKTIDQALFAWAPSLRALGTEVPTARSIVEGLRPLADRIVPQLRDTSSASSLCLIVIPSASQSLPGPEQSARSSCNPRRRRIAGMPWVGCSARIRTALASPSFSQTKLTHQWMP